MFSIYHAFNMRYIDIIKRIPFLKTLGITHIQLPPIQPTRLIDFNSLNLIIKQKKLEDKTILIENEYLK